MSDYRGGEPSDLERLIIRFYNHALKKDNTYNKSLKQLTESRLRYKMLNDTIRKGFPEVAQEALTEGVSGSEVMKSRFKDETRRKAYYCRPDCSITNNLRDYGRSLRNSQYRAREFDAENDGTNTLIDFKLSQLDNALVELRNRVHTATEKLAQEWMTKTSTKAHDYATKYLENIFSPENPTETQQPLEKKQILKNEFLKGLDLDVIHEQAGLGLSRMNIGRWLLPDPNFCDQRTEKFHLDRKPLSSYLPQLEIVMCRTGPNSTRDYSVDCNDGYRSTHSTAPLYFKTGSTTLQAMAYGEQEVARDMKQKMLEETTQQILGLQPSHIGGEAEHSIVDSIADPETLQHVLEEYISTEIDDLVIHRYDAGISGLDEISSIKLKPRLTPVSEKENTSDIILDWENYDTCLATPHLEPKSVNLRYLLEESKGDLSSKQEFSNSSKGELC